MKRVVLAPSDLPDRWYNITPDLPAPLAPYLNPETFEPLSPSAFEQLLPQALIKQEFSKERWLEIPERVREIYQVWRPSPLVRADRLERALDTPAKIYYKFEGVSPAGSHKPNTAIAQAYYNKIEGTKRLTTETGAGQWGSALSFAGSLFDIEVVIYMVKWSYHQKPYSRVMMKTWGGTVYASPTDRTAAGRAILAQDPDSPGSLAMSISEATEDAASRADTKFAPGSVMNYVLAHQTVIGLEAKKQMEIFGDYPDVLVACVGGGSNFGGFAYPFMADRLDGSRPRTRSATRSCRRRSTSAACGTMPTPRRCACSPTKATSRPAPTPRARCSARPCGSHAMRASSSRRSHRTPCVPRSTRRSPPARRVRPGRSCSTCPGSATSTCTRSSGSWPASWRTTRRRMPTSSEP
jgi:tryptophan synthase beta chain